MNEYEKAESCSLLKHIWANIKEDRDMMTSEHRLYIPQSEKCGLWSPNEYLKLAKAQDVLGGHYIYPGIVEACSFKSAIHISLTLHKIHLSEGWTNNSNKKT